MMTIDLRTIAREVFDTSAEPDAMRLAPRIMAAIPSENYAEALEQAIRALIPTWRAAILNDAIRGRVSEPALRDIEVADYDGTEQVTAATDAGPRPRPVFEATAADGKVHRFTSPMARNVFTKRERILAARVSVSSGPKTLGELTAIDAQEMADRRRTMAVGYIREAERWEKIATALAAIGTEATLSNIEGIELLEEAKALTSE